MSVSETLSKAADLIEAHGWVQFKEHTYDGRMCLRGAVALAAGVKQWRQIVLAEESESWECAVTEDVSSDPGGVETFTKATRALLEHNPALGNLRPEEHPVGFLEDWNDAPGRTKEEVVQMLRATAELTRQPADILK